MKQDMIVILDLGSHENTVLARAIRALGVYSEIYPHDITVEELKALLNKLVNTQAIFSLSTKSLPIFSSGYSTSI
jgi:GMP synthase-like glutamine amidotransferase